MVQLMLKEGIAQGRLHMGVVAAGRRLWQDSPWGCCNSSMYPQDTRCFQCKAGVDIMLEV